MSKKFQGYLRKELGNLLKTKRSVRRSMQEVSFTVGRGKRENDLDIINIPPQFYLF